MFPKIDDTEKDKNVCEDRKGQESLVSDSVCVIYRQRNSRDLIHLQI